MINERPHKKLEVWKKSMALVTLIYEETKAFPRDEEYGLKSHLRRAAISVPSNIADGLTQKTKKEKLSFLSIAQSSLSEIDTQAEVCVNMNFFYRAQYEKIEAHLIEIQKLLSSLRKSIRN